MKTSLLGISSASPGDGTCFIIQQDLDYVIDLTEADCDPVYKVRSVAH